MTSAVQIGAHSFTFRHQFDGIQPSWSCTSSLILLTALFRSLRMAIRHSGMSLTPPRSVAGLSPIRSDDGSFSDELISRPILFADRAFLSLLHSEEIADAVVMEPSEAISVSATLSLQSRIRSLCGPVAPKKIRLSYHCDCILAGSAVLNLVHSLSIGIHVVIRLA